MVRLSVKTIIADYIFIANTEIYFWTESHALQPLRDVVVTWRVFITEAITSVALGVNI